MRLIFFFLVSIAYFQSSAQTWDTVGSRMNFPWNPIVSVLYPSDSVLYVFGSYNMIGNDSISRLSKWNGKKWKALSTQNFSETGYLQSICKYKDNLVVTGTFTSIYDVGWANKIALWDYQNWHPFPVQFDCSWTTCEITSSAIFNGDLFVAGNFPENNRIARFDGTSWLDVGGGVIYEVTRINCMAVHNNNLYVGGLFGQAGNIPAFNIAMWDGTQWHDLDTGVSSEVTAILSDTINNVLYVGGYFGLAHWLPVGGIAKWDGQAWSAVGTQNLGGPGIYGFAMYRGKLFAAGHFNIVGNDTLNYIARWNGVKWVPVAGGTNAGIFSIAVFQDDLYVGGGFTKAGTDSAFGIARYYEPPDSACLYFNPVILTGSDTFYLTNSTVPVHFYNNNNRADSWHWNFGDSGTDTVWHPTHNYTAQGNYTISVTVTEAHCTKTVYKSVVVVDTATGINQQPTANSHQPAALKIYPNPATGSITIEIIGAVSHEVIEPVEMPNDVRGNAGSNNSELRITNQHGKLVKTYSIKEPDSKTEINTKGWAKGAYLCSLLVKGKTVKTEKLVIE